MADTADVAYERRDNTAHITTNRPQAMNSLGPDQHDRMVQIWQEFRDDSEVWVGYSQRRWKPRILRWLRPKDIHSVAG